MSTSGLMFGLATLIGLALCGIAEGNNTTCCQRCQKGEVFVETNCTCVPEIFVDHPCPDIRCVINSLPCLCFKRDAWGCRTCECLCKCPRVKCPEECRRGVSYFVDKYGCPFCRCKQPPRCNNDACRLYCVNGYVKDKLGCDTCECVQLRNCTKVCPCGYLVDYRGRILCQCKSRSDCPPICNKNCKYGRVFYNGCPTCQCKPNPDCVGPDC